MHCISKGMHCISKGMHCISKGMHCIVNDDHLKVESASCLQKEIKTSLDLRSFDVLKQNNVDSKTLVNLCKLKLNSLIETVLLSSIHNIYFG